MNIMGGRKKKEISAQISKNSKNVGNYVKYAKLRKLDAFSSQMYIYLKPLITEY